MSHIRWMSCWMVVAAGVAAGDPVAVGRTLEKADVTIVIGSSFSDQNPSTLGQPVYFIARLTVGWNPETNGTVTFFDGTTPLGTVHLDAYQGPPCGLQFPCFGSSAGLTISTLSVGVHQITAAYSGDVNNNPATSNVFVQAVLSSPIPMASGATRVVLKLALVLSGIWLLRRGG